MLLFLWRSCMFEDVEGTGLLIHHWDTDGICSARLLLERLSDMKITNKTPVLGNYFLIDEELSVYSIYDFVIVVDIALPKENILSLAKKSKVIIIDHHLQEEISEVLHHNPISKGMSPEQYPSASWIVNEALGNTVNLFALLGVVGDFEHRIQKNKEFFQRITDFCSAHHLSFDELVHMVYLLDSNYKVGDRNAVEEAPRLLLKHPQPEWILKNECWKKNLGILENEILKHMEEPGEEIDRVLVKKIHTSYNIISTVTRKIAWNTGSDVVVVNTGFFKDRDQIYVRSKKNLTPLIQKGKSLGFRCGGKTEVFGAVVPKEKTEGFVKEILLFFT